MDGASTEPDGRAAAVRMLRASLVPPPLSFPIAWYDGRTGRLLSAEDYTPEVFINELRAMMVDHRPKGEGVALLPGASTPKPCGDLARLCRARRSRFWTTTRARSLWTKRAR